MELSISMKWIDVIGSVCSTTMAHKFKMFHQNLLFIAILLVCNILTVRMLQRLSQFGRHLRFSCPSPSKYHRQLLNGRNRMYNQYKEYHNRMNMISADGIRSQDRKYPLCGSFSTYETHNYRTATLSTHEMRLNYFRRNTRSNTILYARKPRFNPFQQDIQEYLDASNFTQWYPNNSSMTVQRGRDSNSTVLFPEMERAGIDEKALRASPLGKILFPILEVLFPVFKEPNW